MGFKIFKHALTMLLRNWKEALQIFVPPFLAAALILLVVGGTGSVNDLLTMIAQNSVNLEFTSDGEGVSSVANRELGAETAWLAGLTIVLFLIATVWTAVAWHRYVLLEDRPALFARPRPDRMLAYIGRILLLMVCAVLLLLPIGFGLVLLGALGFEAASTLFAIGYFVYMIAVILRLALMLPAAAVGEALWPLQAFQETKGRTGAILLASIMTFSLAIVVSIPLFVLGDTFLATLYDIAMQVFFGILNVSLMTTFYGVFIEKRALS